MAIIGAHVPLYTSEPEALRATLRDVFGWKHVDASGGRLIFALPPAELGGDYRCQAKMSGRGICIVPSSAMCIFYSELRPDRRTQWQRH